MRSRLNETRHARVRAQKRCIPPLVKEWLLAYGARRPSRGAVRVTFDRRARRELSRDVGPALIKQVARFLNVELIVDRNTDEIITSMWHH